MLKDLNFIEINRDLGQSLVNLTIQQIDDLNACIKEDCAFLSKHNLMDYSLLLVIETLNPNRITKLNPSNRNSFHCNDKLLHIGIIDYLQEFNLTKKCEIFFKSLTNPKALLSVQPPETYSKRLADFAINKVIREN